MRELFVILVGLFHFCLNWNFNYLIEFLFKANNPLSCTAYKNAQSVKSRVSINVDVDGSGPLAPFPVTCEYYSKLIVLFF